MELYSNKLKLSGMCVAIAAVLGQTNLTYGSEKLNTPDEHASKKASVDVADESARIIVEDTKIITEDKVQPNIDSAPVTLDRFEKVMQALEKIALKTSEGERQIEVVLKQTIEGIFVPEFYNRNDKRNPLRRDQVIGYKKVIESRLDVESDLSSSQIITDEVDKEITQRVDLVREPGTIIFYKEIKNALGLSGGTGRSAFKFLRFDATLSSKGDSSRDVDFTVTELLEEFYESIIKQ